MEEQKKTYKCDSCGAGLKPVNKYCEYCGSVNKYYKEPETKELKIPNINIGNIMDEMFDDIPFNMGKLFIRKKK